MLFGWGVLLPLGTAMSAGLRDALGSKRWYVAHRNMQIVGLLVAIVGVALALSLQCTSPPMQGVALAVSLQRDEFSHSNVETATC